MAEGRFTPVNYQETRAARARIVRRGGDISLSDPQIDQRWARDVSEDQGRNPYFDYFFTGSDIQVHIAELGDETGFGGLPMHNLGFNVSQQKAPVYGWNSYTYDYMMRGNRIVNGQFSLFSKHPTYMRELIAQAAKNRAERQGGDLRHPYAAYRGLTEDDENIERYWGKTVDPAVAAAGYNEWSTHPPFSLIIVYGMQENSHSTNNIDDMFAGQTDDGHMTFTDYNQRLVDRPLGNRPNKIVLEGVELSDVMRDYTPDGQPTQEVYSFIARDIIIPTGYNPSNRSSNPVTPGGGGGGQPVQAE